MRLSQPPSAGQSRFGRLLPMVVAATGVADRFRLPPAKKKATRPGRIA
jgi:hypothetical protein